jgi:hypothetical protein
MGALCITARHVAIFKVTAALRTWVSHASAPDFFHALLQMALDALWSLMFF